MELKFVMNRYESEILFSKSRFRGEGKSEVQVFQSIVLNCLLNRMKLKRYWFSLLIFTIQMNANAQVNYVPNHSFEVYDTCPNGFLVPYRSIYFAKPWFQPYLPDCSSDLFNSCDTDTLSLGVPNNFMGTQFAQDGIGYAGIVISGGGSYREYLEVELNFTMQINREYCISLYVSLADRSGIASDNIQGHLSSNPQYYTTPWFGIMNLAPSFMSVPGVVFSDTTNWIQVNANYTALGGERFLTIGNFDADSNTTMIVRDLSLPRVSYYYIDNIQIYDCDSITSLNDISNNLKLSVAPNPVASMFEMSYQGYGKSQLEIFSFDGRLLHTENLVQSYGTSKVSLDASGFSNGLYYLRLQSGVYIGTSRIIVLH